MLPFSSNYIVLNNEDHQRMLMALGDCVPQDIKDYAESQGITIDGYTFMGICIDESTGGQKPNYFGAVEGLSTESDNLGTEVAIQALVTSRIASNEEEAKLLMEKDDFYEKAGCVVAYLNNTKDGNLLVTNCYESLTPTMLSDIDAWRRGSETVQIRQADMMIVLRIEVININLKFKELESGEYE